MSITKTWEESVDAPGGRVRLAKALSWHYPNRGYFNSLIVENYRQGRQHATAPRKHDPQLNGINEDEKYEHFRMRLSRQTSFTPAKSRSKASKFIYKAFAVSLC